MVYSSLVDVCAIYNFRKPLFYGTIYAIASKILAIMSLKLQEAALSCGMLSKSISKYYSCTAIRTYLGKYLLNEIQSMKM